MHCLVDERSMEERSRGERSRREERMSRKWVDFKLVWIKRSRREVEEKEKLNFLSTCLVG